MKDPPVLRFPGIPSVSSPSGSDGIRNLKRNGSTLQMLTGRKDRIQVDKKWYIIMLPPSNKYVFITEFLHVSGFRLYLVFKNKNKIMKL